MSMLAERKRRTKWVINPTKKPIWATDSEGVKFGKKLMEKMGWSAGKGLGAQEQGIAEPLRVSYKNDTKGMGFKGNDEDWIEHQDEFNLLLNQLKSSNDSSIISSEQKQEIKSLEEKSKNSRVRVHYQKFTRGKDLSKYSEKDLACILGTGKIKKKENVVEGKVEASSNNTFGVVTINSGSMQDYFNKKNMADKFKKKSAEISYELPQGSEEMDCNFENEELLGDTKVKKEKTDVLSNNDNLNFEEEYFSEEVKSNSRKKKKTKDDLDSSDVTPAKKIKKYEESCFNNANGDKENFRGENGNTEGNTKCEFSCEGSDLSVEKSSKKKKKKSKDKEKSSDLNIKNNENDENDIKEFVCNPDESFERKFTDHHKKKKSKRKTSEDKEITDEKGKELKSKVVNFVGCESENETLGGSEIIFEKIKTKKKKHKKKSMDEEDEDKNECLEGNMYEEEKVVNDQNVIDENTLPVDNSDFESSKSKKKKKKKDKYLDKDTSTIENSHDEDNKKRKKNKVKSKESAGENQAEELNDLNSENVKENKRKRRLEENSFEKSKLNKRESCNGLDVEETNIEDTNIATRSSESELCVDSRLNNCDEISSDGLKTYDSEIGIKKEKKKKKKKEKIEIVNGVGECEESVDVSEEVVHKKKLEKSEKSDDLNVDKGDKKTKVKANSKSDEKLENVLDNNNQNSKEALDNKQKEKPSNMLENENNVVVYSHKSELFKKPKIKTSVKKFQVPNNYTNERVLNLVCCAQIEKFKGSSLGNIVGYGMKKETESEKVIK